MDSSDPPLARLLFSDGPAPDRADKMGLYGWLIGDWAMDAVIPMADGGTHKGRGEISFAWVLEGRAIQDVWIVPDFFYGTTLRVYDPAIDSWHILWGDPLMQYYNRQIGRAHGADIVQLGKSDDGTDHAGAFAKSPPTRSAGWAKSRPTAARPGGCKPNSNADAKPDTRPDRGGS